MDTNFVQPFFYSRWSEKVCSHEDARANLSDVVVVRELPGPHGRRADVTNLARLNEIVQGLYGLLQSSVSQ
jgi:hypothetical protein